MAKPMFLLCLYSIHLLLIELRKTLIISETQVIPGSKGKFTKSCMTISLGCKIVHPARTVLASREMCHQTHHTSHCAGLHGIHFDPSDVNFVLLIPQMF